MRTNQNLSDRLKDVENTLLSERKEHKVQASANEWQAKVTDLKEQYAAKVQSLYGQMENLRAEYESKLDALRDQPAVFANPGKSSSTKKTKE